MSGTVSPMIALRQPSWMVKESTNAVRLIHGVADGLPGFYLDRFGPCLLATAQNRPSSAERAITQQWMDRLGCKGVYLKQWNRAVRQTHPDDASPKPWLGTNLPAMVPFQEHGVHYEARFEEGYSVGLFLDQRLNRRLWRGLPVQGLDSPALPSKASGECLNTFAYTCGFSVCAALGGMQTCSLDLSRKYLDWGRKHFEMNQIPLAGHDFIYGDVFDWLRRFHKRGRRFAGVILDPPTFSKAAKSRRSFRAMADYPLLLKAALDCLESGGHLLACNNTAGWSTASFLRMIHQTLQGVRGSAYQLCSLGQPADFPSHPHSPAHLKSVWIRV